MGDHHAEVTALGMRDMSLVHDCILGTPYLKRHRVVLDVAAQTASLRSTRGRHVMVARSTTAQRGEERERERAVGDDDPDHDWQNFELDPRLLTTSAIELVSPKQALIALRHGEQFLAARPEVTLQQPLLRLPCVLMPMVRCALDLSLKRQCMAC
jgi:hypothetical protein